MEDEPSVPALVLDPEYQRGHVWTEEQQRRFAGHVIEGGAVPPIIVRRDRTYQLPDEVVDGKQRLTALYRWLKDEIPAELRDGTLLWIHDLDPEAKRFITGIGGPHLSFRYGYWTQREVLDLYIKLNRGGTVHTDAEIDRVRQMLSNLA